MGTIFKSLFVVVAVAAVAGGATWAYFTDTETSVGNTFTTGTIDIAVDSENPWKSTGQYMFSGLEPSDEEPIDVTLKNVGTNSVVIWKKIHVTEEKDVTESEPECDAEGGKWSGSDCSDQAKPKNDLSTQFVYGMKIGGNTNINRAWDVRVSDVNDLWIPIGRLDSNQEVA